MRLSAPGLLLLALGVAACSSGPPPPDRGALVRTIEEERAEKDRQFREAADSPIPPGKRGLLLPLQYYPPDPAFVVPAVLRLADSRPVVEMPTSTGTLRRYELVGTLEFTLQGQAMSLGAFVPAGEPVRDLFVPFADLTTGKETYPAGRYLDVKPTATGVYSIDFNRAYNPYCAYNLAYECPFPPPSNRLAIEVRAGEKSPPA